MNRKTKKIMTYLVLCSLLIVLGVVYAILQANLQINGTAKISENQWNVHFENIVVNQNSVPIGTGDIAATIDPTNNCKVDFSVTLSLPGDFYEFTVDVKNTGTIDAMIGTLTKTLKVNNVAVENVPEYLIYTITYEDNSEILENHLLAKGAKETYKVRVEFKTDIDADDLPDATTLSMSFEPTYVQADEHAEESHPAITMYGVYNQNYPVVINQAVPSEVILYNTPEEAIEEWPNVAGGNIPRQFYLVHKIKNDLVTETYIGFEITPEMKQQYPEVNVGHYAIKGYPDGSYYEENKEILKQAFGYETNSSHCRNITNYFFCSLSGMTITTYNTGSVTAGKSMYFCNFYPSTGSSVCEYDN